MRSAGVYVVALAPLSAEETAALILRQAQKCNAPVKQIDSGKDTANDNPPSIFAIGLILVGITFFLWKFGIIGGKQ
jgi:siroheme synthase (precorrin-2 oxidase/ferrochelatase)